MRSSCRLPRLISGVVATQNVGVDNEVELQVAAPN